MVQGQKPARGGHGCQCCEPQVTWSCACLRDFGAVDILGTADSGSSDKTTNIDITNDKTIDEDETTTTTQHLHGNIGVTTNTQLQTEEYQLLADYNPYIFISGLFENELTLCIY